MSTSLVIEDPELLGLLFGFDCFVSEELRCYLYCDGWLSGIYLKIDS